MSLLVIQLFIQYVKYLQLLHSERLSIGKQISNSSNLNIFTENVFEFYLPIPVGKRHYYYSFCTFTTATVNEKNVW